MKFEISLSDCDRLVGEYLINTARMEINALNQFWKIKIYQKFDAKFYAIVSVNELGNLLPLEGVNGNTPFLIDVYVASTMNDWCSFNYDTVDDAITGTLKKINEQLFYNCEAKHDAPGN